MAQKPLNTGRSKASIDHCASMLQLHFGQAIRGLVLARLLGFRSLRSYQRAAQEDKIAVRLHPIPGQTGRCATAMELAKWLVESDQDWKKLIEDIVRRSKK